MECTQFAKSHHGDNSNCFVGRAEIDLSSDTRTCRRTQRVISERIGRGGRNRNDPSELSVVVAPIKKVTEFTPPLPVSRPALKMSGA